MTYDELNRFICHYLEKDLTGRALMLTGPWGTGKSYYIRNSLIPYLASSENGEHQCVVVSLFGLTNLSELSKAIYFEARIKKLQPKTEKGQTAIFAAKTVAKGVASFFGIDLSKNEEEFQKLFESIDLSGRLLILEDVERTSISLVELLGYISNLAEQDGVKVLLVTNEEAIIKYKPLIRGAFLAIYRPGNIGDTLADDAEALTELLREIEAAEHTNEFDRIQQFQCRMFRDNLRSFLKRLPEA